MIGFRIILEKNKKEKIVSQMKEISFLKNLKNENIENYKLKNTLVWEFEIEQDILSNDLLSIFSNIWNITLDDHNISSAISETRIKFDGVLWINLELY